MTRNTSLVSDNIAEINSILGEHSIKVAPSSPVSAGDKFLDAHIVWSKGTDILKTHLDKQIYTAWIKPLNIVEMELSPSHSEESAQVTLSAPNKFCRDHVKRHYGAIISTTLSEILGAKDTVLSFRVNPAEAIQPEQPQKGTTASSAKDDQIKRRQKKNPSRSSYSSPAKKQMRKGAARSHEQTNLNPKYNFSNYIVGGCNQFAHAVSVKVAENIGCIYNPLFIYGGVGLGKTHLANAIGNATHRRNKNVLLISSETFVSELIAALRSNNMVLFKNRLRSVDLLIVDDIQFLIGKERTQEEFFHTFNELYNRHKQIVITSDKLPQELTGLEERLRTRFASGLSADLQAPDFETRVAILIKKSEMNGICLPDPVARLLAERISTNVRELEGALNRLQALCSLHETNPSMELAEEVLSCVAPGTRSEINTEIIQKTVASCYHVSINDLLGKRRTQNIAFARQVAMYLSRQLTTCSYPEIGALFGGRDHSTVIHAKRVVDDKLQNDPSFRDELKRIEGMLYS